MKPPARPEPAHPHREHDARFGATRDGVAVLAPDWRIRYANASMLEILRLIGREDVASLWEALPDWEDSPEAGELRRAMEERAHVAFRVSGRAGAGRVWEVEAEPLPTGELRVRLRNVTAAARAEELQKSFDEASRGIADAEAERKVLFDVIDTLPVGVAVGRAPDGRIAYLNAAAVALGGRGSAELAAHELAEYVERWRIFRPSGEPMGTDELPMARALRGETTREVELLLRPPDGPERTVLASGAPLHDAEGRVDRAVVAFYDITERLRLERALVRQRAEAEMAASEAALRAEESRALRDIARALVSELEPERVLQLAVRHAMELIGARGSAVTTPLPDGASMRIAPAAGLLAVLEGSVYPWEGSVAARVAEVGRTLRFNDVDDIPATSPVLPVVRRMGVRNAAFVPLRAFGEFFGIISVVDREDGFSDEDVRVLEALADSAALAVRNARLYEGAQAASRAKSEFLAMMSHELRTPLNALEGYASLLEDGIYGPVNAQQAQALGRMRAARQHLVELIERVLDVARVEAGVKRLDVEEVDAAALARSVAEALRGAAEHKGLALRVEAEEVGKIRTDAAMVRQVLTNLLGNAFKFTETGTVVLRVAGDGERVRMEVSDTGPGIAAEHHERIFEPFYQVDPSTTRREGGTGLGLALSREFARLLGGDIAVRSTPGGGSTFVLTLPRTPASS